MCPQFLKDTVRQWQHARSIRALVLTIANRIAEVGDDVHCIMLREIGNTLRIETVMISGQWHLVMEMECKRNTTQ